MVRQRSARASGVAEGDVPAVQLDSDHDSRIRPAQKTAEVEEAFVDECHEHGWQDGAMTEEEELAAAHRAGMRNSSNEAGEVGGLSYVAADEEDRQPWGAAAGE